MLAQAKPNSAPERDMIPKPLLVAILALVVTSLAIVGAAAVTGRAHVGVPKAATILAERSVILQGGGAQAVTVLAADGSVMMDLPHGGFITVIQNGLERARTNARLDQSLPVRIIKYDNGRLAVLDDASGWSAELGAFGSDNRAAFERLMSQN
ncbi:photosynthetic complex assembly protein PuhC [Cypionkella sp.]|uniref:photosynthetic complex assembly protein PuhC n=1 Tax=Cypionkella sp. TaxID=2811411 RepID=UPI002FDDE367